MISKVYHCDNLPLLRSMPPECITLVYCDVLYGTGRKFKEYDDLKSNKINIYGHYIPRLHQMKRVLNNRGTVYIQVDWRISHWMRDMLDQVFGRDNFLNEIIWHYNSAPRRKVCFGSRHDTIFRYSKTSEVIFNEDAVREPYSPTAPRGFEKEKYYNNKGKVMGDVWTMPMLGQNDKTERVKYSNQKPLALAKRIIEVSSNPGDTVADFYCGSGTTLVAAKILGRGCFGCDISKEAIQKTKIRLKRKK